MIAVTEAERALILAILRRHVPHCEIRAFGSRITGGAKQYSDLDLAVCGSAKLLHTVIDDMRYDFQLSSLPFRLDVMDYCALSPEFRAIIDRGYEVIYSPAPPKPHPPAQATVPPPVSAGTRTAAD